ncbi:MAG: helix-turn-helix domain-containing protein [Rickettsiales bacterium]
MKNTRADVITNNLVRLLKEERKRKNISHQMLANAAGIHRSTVSLIESGKRTPTITVCLKIAGALELDFAKLMKKAQMEE